MCVKIDLKFSTVCEKMSENRRPQGVFFLLTLYMLRFTSIYRYRLSS